MSIWDDTDRAVIDPILDELQDALAKVTDNFEHRNYLRKRRGDEPLPGAPYITVSVETEHRVYPTMRVFNVDRVATFLDLHSDKVSDPKVEQVNPIMMRTAAIVSAVVHTNYHTLPVEIPMTKADLDAAVEAFAAEAERIMSTGTTACKDDVSAEQCSALVKAANPVNDFIFESTIGATWERYKQAVCARHGSAKVLDMPATDKRLNRMVVTTDYGKRTGMPLLRFFTHGVPLEFLYTETHQLALDAYNTYVEGVVRREKKTNG